MNKVLCLFVFLCVAGISSGWSQGEKSVYSQITLPKVNTVNATFTEVLAFLRQQGQRLNPTTQPININYTGTPPAEPNINLQLADVSLIDALQALAAQVGYQVQVSGAGIMLTPAESRSSAAAVPTASSNLPSPTPRVPAPVTPPAKVTASPFSSPKPDITLRATTDPLLRVSSSSSLLPEKDDKSLGAVRDESHVPPVYRRLWNQRDVIMLEPFSREKPGEIDFSAITRSNKGVLRIAARNHPAGDFSLEILKNGQVFKKETIGSNKWERFTVPFDNEPVIVRNVANGWSFEFAFIDYSIGAANQ